MSGRVFEDLATGDSLVLVPKRLSADIGDDVSFGLFTTIDDGRIAAARPLVPLDGEALALARSFVRPGNLGLGNGVHCAEAVYRHIVRNGIAPVAATGAGSGRKPKLLFRPNENRLDALAAARAGPGRDPTVEELAQARGFASHDALMEALLSVTIARNGGAPELASAYTRIAAVLIETMALREARGSGRRNLDAVAAAAHPRLARQDGRAGLH
jgi:hypothetical protein